MSLNFSLVEQKLRDAWRGAINSVKSDQLVNQLEIPCVGKSGEKIVGGKRRSRSRIEGRRTYIRWRGGVQQVEEGEAKGKRSPERDRRGVLYRGEEREVQTRDDATGSHESARCRSLSLASGLESRGGADRSSIGVDYCLSLLFFCEPQRRKLVVVTRAYMLNQGVSGANGGY